MALAQGTAGPDDYVKQPRYVVPNDLIAPHAATLLPGGFSRTDNMMRHPAAADPSRAKAGTIDPATGEILAPHARFFLPENWNWTGLPGPVDSLGRAIVNERIGWSAWTQFDVDALRSEIAQRLADRDATLATSEAMARELDGVLGNFIGQALVRGIVIDDIVNLYDDQQITPTVRASILERLRGYEVARRQEMRSRGKAYEQSTYPANIVAWIEQDGTLLSHVLDIDATAEDEIAERSVPSGCYGRVSQLAGLNLLAGATVIWNADGTDDASADVPIGFPFRFYHCETAAPNTAVRVSSNGYVSFFQQGGGALNGIDYLNTPIGTPTGPNGFIAGFWQDLAVLNQVVPDSVRWKIEGGPGNRELIIEYNSVSTLHGTNADYHYFQIVLDEQRGNTQREVAEITFPTEASGLWYADPADAATVGMENFAGDDGDCPPSCALVSDVPLQSYAFFPQAGDVCGDAEVLQLGNFQQDDLRFSLVNSNHCQTANADRWYRFIAPCAGQLNVATCGSHDYGGVDAGVDTVLAIFAGCPENGGTLLGCDDDGGTCEQFFGVQRDSELTVNIPANTPIYVRVASYWPISDNSEIGTIYVSTNFTPSQFAANDAYQNASVLNPTDSVLGSLICATPDGAREFGQGNLWYLVESPLTGTFRFSTCGTSDLTYIDAGFDSVLEVFDGLPNVAANRVAVNDDALGVCGSADLGYELDAAVTISAVAGEQFYVSVASLFNLNGDGSFVFITRFLSADLNGDCLVNLTDLATLLTNFGLQAGATPEQGDIDGDEDVDLSDLATMLANFGASCE